MNFQRLLELRHFLYFSFVISLLNKINNSCRLSKINRLLVFLMLVSSYIQNQQNQIVFRITENFVIIFNNLKKRKFLPLVDFFARYCM